MLAIMIAGIENTTMNDATSIDHTNRGMRLSDMPGARILNVVTMIAIAMISPDTSVKVMSCAQISARLP